MRNRYSYGNIVDTWGHEIERLSSLPLNSILDTVRFGLKWRRVIIGMLSAFSEWY